MTCATVLESRGEDRPMCTRARLLATLLALITITLAPTARAQSPQSSFVSFESGQVRPLALSPDGTHLFAVNTPDNRLEIFDVAADGSLVPRTPATYSTHTVPPGIEPAAVAARPTTRGGVRGTTPGTRPGSSGCPAAGRGSGRPWWSARSRVTWCSRGGARAPSS